MSNADINLRLKKLQSRIGTFYDDGKKSSNKDGAKKMAIEEKYTVVAKETPILPGDHLIRASYKDVIERDGSTSQKIRFCVSSSVELKKCEILKKAAYSRDIRPEIMCLEKSKSECMESVKNSEADVLAVHPDDYRKARAAQLKAILYESLDKSDVYVVVAPKELSQDIISRGDVHYDSQNVRSVNAALEFLFKRGTKKCPATITDKTDSPIKIVRSTTLSDYSKDTYELVCPDMSRKPLDADFTKCNFEYTLRTAIFSRASISIYELDNISHAFTAISEKFGHDGKLEQVFDIFAEFEKGQNDVIFDVSIYIYNFFLFLLKFTEIYDSLLIRIMLPNLYHRIILYLPQIMKLITTSFDALQYKNVEIVFHYNIHFLIC